MAKRSVRKTRYAKTVSVKEEIQTGPARISEADFIIYLTSALVLRGVVWLNKEDTPRFVQAFQEAYKTAAYHIAHKGSLRFTIIAHEIHGTSDSVDKMIAHLTSHWARRGESRHVIYLDEMTPLVAERYLKPGTVSDPAIWIPAADSFIETFADDSHYWYIGIDHAASVRR